MKKILCLIICATMLLTVPLTATASEMNSENVISPRYQEINTIYSNLSIDKTWGIATCTGKVVSKGMDPVEVWVTLQQYKDGRWQSLKTWSESGTLHASCTNQYAVARGYQYRVYVTGYVYDENGTIIDAGSGSFGVIYD